MTDLIVKIVTSPIFTYTLVFIVLAGGLYLIGVVLYAIFVWVPNWKEAREARHLNFRLDRYTSK